MAILVKVLLLFVSLFILFFLPNLSTKSLVFKLQVMTHLVGHEINVVPHDQYFLKNPKKQ